MKRRSSPQMERASSCHAARLQRWAVDPLVSVREGSGEGGGLAFRRLARGFRLATTDTLWASYSGLVGVSRAAFRHVDPIGGDPV